MKGLEWFERQFTFGLLPEMLPFYLERLEGTLIRLQQKVKDVDEELVSTRFNGKWSIKENIGHLAEVDEVGFKRIDEMVNEVSVLFQPYSSHRITTRGPLKRCWLILRKHVELI